MLVDMPIPTLTQAYVGGGGDGPPTVAIRWLGRLSEAHSSRVAVSHSRGHSPSPRPREHSGPDIPPWVSGHNSIGI